MTKTDSKMRLLGRAVQLVVVLCCVLVIAQSFALWSATGRERFTKNLVPSEQSTEEQAAGDGGGMGDLFADTGIEDAGTDIEVTTRRAFGLLPAAYPWRIWDPHLASVATIAGPAAVMALGVLILPALMRRGPGRTEEPQSPSS